MFGVYYESGEYENYRKTLLFVTNDKGFANLAVDQLKVYDNDLIRISEELRLFRDDLLAKNPFPDQPEKPKFVKEESQKNHLVKIDEWKKLMSTFKEGCNQHHLMIYGECEKYLSTKTRLSEHDPRLDPYMEKPTQYFSKIYNDVEYSVEEVDYI